MESANSPTHRLEIQLRCISAPGTLCKEPSMVCGLEHTIERDSCRGSTQRSSTIHPFSIAYPTVAARSWEGDFGSSRPMFDIMNMLLACPHIVSCSAWWAYFKIICICYPCRYYPNLFSDYSKLTPWRTTRYAEVHFVMLAIWLFSEQR